LRVIAGVEANLGASKHRGGPHLAFGGSNLEAIVRVALRIVKEYIINNLPKPSQTVLVPQTEDRNRVR